MRRVLVALLMLATLLATGSPPAGATQSNGLQDTSETWGGNYTSSWPTEGSCHTYHNSWFGRGRFGDGGYSVSLAVQYWENPVADSVPAGQQFASGFWINPSLSTSYSNAAHYTSIAPSIYTVGYTGNSSTGGLRWSGRVPGVQTQTNARYLIRDIVWYVTESNGAVSAFVMRDEGSNVAPQSADASNMSWVFQTGDQQLPIEQTSAWNATMGAGSTTHDPAVEVYTDGAGREWTSSPHVRLVKNSMDHACVTSMVQTVASGVGYCQNNAAHPLGACNSRRASLLSTYGGNGNVVDWWLEPIPNSGGYLGMPWSSTTSFPPLQPRAAWMPAVNRATSVRTKVNSSGYTYATENSWVQTNGSQPYGAAGYYQALVPLTLNTQGYNSLDTMVGDQTVDAPAGYRNEVYVAADEVVYLDSVAPSVSGLAVSNTSATQFQVSATNISDPGYNSTDGVGMNHVDTYWRPFGSSTWQFAGTTTMAAGGGSFVQQVTGSFTVGQDYEVRLVAYDRLGNSSQSTAQVTFPYPNHPPVALPDAATLAVEDGSITIDVLANDSDEDDNHASPIIRNDFGIDVASLGVTVQPTNGSVVKSGTELVYYPDAGFVGSETFEYQVCDKVGACDQAIVTMTVTGNPPNAADDLVTAERVHLPVTAEILGNDTPGSGALDPGSVSVSGVPSGLTVTVNPDGTVTLGSTDPDPGTSTTYEFDYQVCNTYGLCDGATVTVILDPLLPT